MNIKTKTIQLAPGFALEMIHIPGGSFMMGSPDTELATFKNERPQHQVTVSPFWMGKYPVTQAQWRVVAGLPQVKRELDPAPSRFKGDERPVEGVSWYDAMEFCARLSALTGQEYRLPSEAQWEYACRAGTTTPFHFGETISQEQANYLGTAETTEVGSFPQNSFGLYDMHGNVLEWCLDYWHSNYKGAPADGSVWVTGRNSDRRVLRGGSWVDYPRSCRSAFRDYFNPNCILNFIGFRVVCLA